MDTTTTGFEQHVSKLFTKFDTKIEKQLHAAVGAAGEAGELLDAIKKPWVYGKPIDLENVLEECGDLLFYTTAMLMECGMTIEDAFAHNIKKLSKRYPSGVFTEKDARDRIDKESETIPELVIEDSGAISVKIHPLPEEVVKLMMGEPADLSNWRSSFREGKDS